MVNYPQRVDAESLFSCIQARTGLGLNIHQRNDVLALLNDLPENRDLLDLLSESSLTHPLWQRIIRMATVGETYFFRNQAQFDALRSDILPTLIEERRRSGNKHLRIWSAGSATGEEPYSVAILLRELLPDIDTWSITLLATDLNEDYLDYARRGVYRARSFRSETPDGLRERWFVPEPDGSCLVPTIRNMVMFRPLNLVSDNYPALETNTMYMDVIFCRNVTIYFDRETTRLVVERFYQALNSNGWLVVGHSEPQAELYQGFVSRNFKHTVIYQKPDHVVEIASPPMPAPIRPVAKPQPQHARAAKPAIAFPTHQPEPVVVLPLTEDFWSLAKAAADLERWDEARGWLDKADQKDPFQPQIHYLRALVELQTGHIEQGFQLLRRSIYCDGNFALAHYLLGDLYAQQEMRKGALRHWQLAFEAIEHRDGQQILPYSDDLTVEMLVELLVARLSGINDRGIG